MNAWFRFLHLFIHLCNISVKMNVKCVTKNYIYCNCSPKNARIFNTTDGPGEKEHEGQEAVRR